MEEGVLAPTVTANDHAAATVTVGATCSGIQ